MIYTITFNPAIDLVMNVKECQLGNLNRSTHESYLAGGKGINISIILKRLGRESIATGFLGGFSGQFIKDQLINEGISTHFIDVDGITRINLKLKSTTETEINAAGAVVSEKNFEQLFSYLEENLTHQDIVFLAGNIAPGMDEAAYISIAKLCQTKGTKLVLDTTKQLLTSCLAYEPFIIKPNHHELGEIFNKTLTTVSEIIDCAKQLQQQGAKNVLVSRGGEGAILITENQEVYQSNVPKGEVINSVGAGDSMLAGFINEYIKETNYVNSLLFAAATGSATAFSTGIATKELVDKLVKDIEVTKINYN